MRECVLHLKEGCGGGCDGTHLQPGGSERPERALCRTPPLGRAQAAPALSRSPPRPRSQEIEGATGLRTCIVYGALPAETRRAQARLFNDPASGHRVLVASDAIGMGLNFNIRRVVFSTMEKSGGPGRRRGPVPASLVKQIAGRAGRRNRCAAANAAGAAQVGGRWCVYVVWGQAARRAVAPLRTGQRALTEQAGSAAAEPGSTLTPPPPHPSLSIGASVPRQ